MKPFLIRWLVITLAVALTAHLFAGIRYDNWEALLLGSLLLGVINAFVRPVLLILSLPLILFSMGFFILVINALMLMLVGGIIPGFNVEGFWWAFFGAICISIISWLLSAFFRDSEGRYHVITHHGGGPKQARGRVVED